MFNYSKLIIFGIIAGLLLSGCSDSSTQNAKTPEEDSKPAAQTPKSKEKEENDISEPTTDEDGNTILEEVGQVANSEAGSVELKKIKIVNETVDISPMKITVQDIKVLEMTDVDPEFAESLTWQADTDLNKVKDGFSYVQVRYQAENTTESNIEWYDLMNVITDQGEQIDAQMKDFLVDDADMDSEFIGKVKKDFVDGFILKTADVKSIKLIFGSTMNADSYEDITPEQTVEYLFD